VSKKILDLEAIRQARANLKALAEAHPRLLGPSTPAEWEATLKSALTTSERQRDLKQRRKAEGIHRVMIWISDDDREALRLRYPGPRNGIDWQAVITAALTDTRP
jgi:hypothetical protein